MQRQTRPLFITAKATGMAAVLCAGLLWAPACGDGHSTPRLIILAVSPGAAQVPLGTQGQFRAAGKFDDGQMQDLTASVSWDTSAGNIATISSSGVLTTIALGQAFVRAKYGSAAAYANLTVSSPILLSLSVSPSSGVIPLGGGLQLSAMGRFSDQTVKDITQSVNWASSNPGVAPVSPAGLVNAKALGTASVSATQGSANSSASLSITDAALVSIAVSAGSSSIPIGDETQVTAQGTFTDNSIRDITNLVTWTSSSPGVISISNGGLAQAKSLGMANMIASKDSIIGFKSLTAVAATLTSITVSSTQYVLPLGTYAQLTATGYYSDGSQQNLTQSVQWSSSSPQIISISNSGLATANAIGSSTATATSNTTFGSAQLSVSPAQLLSISVSPQGVLVPIGQRQQMTATGSYTDGTKYDLTPYVTWSSDKMSVATVDSNGMAVAVNIGIANIGASYQGLNASSPLTVQPLLSVNFFTNPQGAPDTTLRIFYPNANTTDLCAMLYVFDQNQQMTECCGCVVTQDGMRTLSVQNDLTSNPLTGVQSTAGTVNMVAADHASNPSCDPSVTSPSGTLVSWSTNLQATGNGGYAIQEAGSASSPLTDTQLSAAQAQCSFIETLGSGQGICSCGTGH